MRGLTRRVDSGEGVLCANSLLGLESGNLGVLLGSAVPHRSGHWAIRQYHSDMIMGTDLLLIFLGLLTILLSLRKPIILSVDSSFLLGERFHAISNSSE
jgi:hypothetical protein